MVRSAWQPARGWADSGHRSRRTPVIAHPAGRLPLSDRAAVLAVSRASSLFLREVRLPERWWRR
ncbi:hypothetical protein ABZU42_24740, partial [Micromonospora profundi]|uniref:hypothetical protein n=1 Tax=Micromonospora profundi TaxID=1420889 RepID=UPI0033A3257D